MGLRFLEKLFPAKKRAVEQLDDFLNTENKPSETETLDNYLLKEMEQQPARVEFEKVDLKDNAARIGYLERLFESIQEAKKQCGDVKFEYGQVTSYLKDIQLIDQAPDEEKSGLYAAARKIVDLTAERKRLQHQSYKMTDAQKRAMENYEPNVKEDILKLRGYEDYQLKINEDLRQIAGEQDMLVVDKQEIIQRQGTLKLIGKWLAGILSAIGAMLLALVFCFRVDATVPFIATVAFGLVTAAVILNEAKKNRVDMVVTEKKCNRAIALGNRVKIKHVNNVRALDYMRHKYHVRNAPELEFVFGEYRRAKREWAKQNETAVLIKENSRILIHELERLGVKDKDIWLSQAEALVNPKEMVEVRHDLNVRRQKLRSQMDYNTGIMEQCLAEMEKIRDESEEYSADVEMVLSRGI